MSESPFSSHLEIGEANRDEEVCPEVPKPKPAWSFGRVVTPLPGVELVLPNEGVEVPKLNEGVVDVVPEVAPKLKEGVELEDANVLPKPTPADCVLVPPKPKPVEGVLPNPVD